MLLARYFLLNYILLAQCFMLCIGVERGLSDRTCPRSAFIFFYRLLHTFVFNLPNDIQNMLQLFLISSPMSSIFSIIFHFC